MYQSDLEKAVQYSLFTEISSQPMFDLAKKDALVLYIDSLLHYFPNQSPEMESFLKALIQWLRQWQYQVLTPEMFKAKANVSTTIVHQSLKAHTKLCNCKRN